MSLSCFHLLNVSNEQMSCLLHGQEQLVANRTKSSWSSCLASVLPSLIDRLGDAKDQVRDQDQALLLKIMDQAANPQVVLESRADVEHMQVCGGRTPHVVCVSAVCVGENDGRLQAQEHQDQRGTVSVPHLHLKRVSVTASSGRQEPRQAQVTDSASLMCFQVWISESDAQ